jgi:hypothetical protein
MISHFTQVQLDNLTVDARRPLIICDVDDVVVHFLRGFDAYLAARDHVLEITSFQFGGNVRHAHTGEVMADPHVAEHIDSFFHLHTETMEPIEGAVESLLHLGEHAQVVMLTNLPHHAREKRVRNLAGLGLPYPVITNEGPKGPAIKSLAQRSNGNVVFVDDSPGFVQSSHTHAPDVKIVHFLHDPRFAKLHKPFDFVSLTTERWDKARVHIEGLITA